MRKVTLSLLLLLLVTLGACGNKKSEAPLSSKNTEAGRSLLPITPFEGILTMQTTIPEVGSTTTRLFIAKEGVRTESSSNIQAMNAPLQMAIVSPAQTPNLIYIINTATKSYTVIDTDKMNLENSNKGDDYNNAKIENLGKELLNGYNCIHVRVTKGESVMEMWVSKEILDYFTYARMQGTRDKSLPLFAKRMKDAGLDGFPVKIWHKQSNILTELTKVEKQGIDASLFKVPAGYTRNELPSMHSAASPDQRKELEKMVKQMQEEMKEKKP